ncbi:MAG TPA: ParB/RepB/Spo0J family partition protein [Ignavibacteria bacterium]|nr:ParB/RepB/Spo0J family partition protein [Ignavibacteria bacterium]
MDNKTSVLGKGLSAIFTEKNVDLNESEVPVVSKTDEIPVEKIKVNPLQPREDFDEEKLKELADSVKQKGLIQPITVLKKGDDFILISGERRLRAVKMIGLEKVQAYIYDSPLNKELTNEDLLELALIENLQRSDLNPMELSDSYSRLSLEFNLTQEQIAGRVSKQRSTVANFLRLQRLPVEIKVSLRRNEITEAHARMLLRIDTLEDQLILWKRIINENITVKNLEEITKPSVKKQRKKKVKLGEIYDPYLQDIEDKLRNYFGTKVKINRKTKFSGEIVIEYFSNDDLERITEKCDT